MKRGAILLAAGGSRRMGTPKQLLKYEGEPLVRRSARTILAAGFDPLCVVVGHRHEEVAGALHGLDVHLCVHEGWACGIGSSLRQGMMELERCDPEVACVLVALADQPGVTAAHLALLAAGLNPEIRAVASAYQETLGVPAIFARSVFAELKALPDECGAKVVLGNQPGARVAVIPLAASEDVDWPGDYEELLARSASRGN